MIGKSFLFFIVSFFYCSSCFCQDTTFLDAKWDKTVRGNAVYITVEKKQGTKWLRTDYFVKNGQLQMKGTLSSLSPETRDGYFEWFFENGKLKHKGSYTNGKETGLHLWFNENSNLEAKENYLNGKYEGEYEEHYPNGKLKDKSSFINGIQSGWTTYYREDGSRESEGNFKKGLRDGIWKYFDEKGNLQGTDTIHTEYNFAKANLFLQLPNDEWHLAVNNAPVSYIFKRNPIVDSNGRNIIPAIMVYVDDAKAYGQNIDSFSDSKSKPFINSGVKVLERFKWGDKGYPLGYKNAVFIKGEYTVKAVEHIIYMIQIINKQDTGIQIYLDMTKDISGKYEPEFWTTINSIKELN